MIFNPYYNYYAGNIKQSKPLGFVYLSQMIRAIKEPKPEIIALVDAIRTATKENNESLKAELKQRLFSFTPAVICYPNRKYSDIKEFTGLMPLDFDKLGSVNEAKELKQSLFDTFDFIICAWLSSSGKGVRALARIPKVETVEQYKLHFHAFEHYIGEKLNGFDFAPQNPVLPLFLSIDNDLLYRLDADVYNETFDKEAYKKKELEKLNDLRNSQKIQKERIYKVNNKSKYYENKEELSNAEIVQKIIECQLRKVTDAGHPIVRAVSYAVGGYIASDYINQYDAERLIFNEIDNHPYLRQKESIYKKTVLQMIESGKNSPLKFTTYE